MNAACSASPSFNGTCTTHAFSRPVLGLILDSLERFVISFMILFFKVDLPTLGVPVNTSLNCLNLRLLLFSLRFSTTGNNSLRFWFEDSAEETLKHKLHASM